MKSISVQSLPLRQVIQNLSKQLGTSYIDRCEEYILKLPPEIGKGEIRGINFNGGLGILLYDCLFNEDLEIKFVVNEIHPLKFLYCLEGKLFHRFENENTQHEIEQYQEAIVASERNNGHVLQFKKNIKTKIYSLEIARESFIRKIDCDLKNVGSNLYDLFNDVKAINAFYHNGFYSLQLASIFKEMENFKEENFIRKLFLEGKAYEVLTKQIQLYLDDQKGNNNTLLLRRSEVKQIEITAKHIEQNLSNLSSIQEIASEVGLNVNKLQEGFRYLFGTTVKEFIKEKRYSKIQELLVNTDLQISEISDLVGISSKSYISKIFKERTGMTPQEFRVDYKEALSSKIRTIRE
ncbi:helix-turn-helix domain-containing protein [Euzebyella saccharophila]|uniref:Helix-turn-helix domain-containing protein n=1 Tax=Euzebyella saccharophila TaxID=679664 RepID=A0ABV8JQW6_9FLAO|nr:AraC family transcriptional regulator [Euzebyella saccharophila]